MANTFFELTPENYDEVHEKWLNLSTEELRMVSVGKSRIYVSVDDIELIQDAFQVMLQVAKHINEEGLEETNKRRIMQMGYALEQIKHRLIKDIENGRKKSAN